MPYPISAIRFKNDVFKEFYCNDECSTDDSKEKTLRNLNKINLFVGQNNSGKSRFLRKLFFQEIGELDISPNIIETENDINWQRDIQQIFNVKSQILMLLNENVLNSYKRRPESIPIYQYIQNINIDPFSSYASENFKELNQLMDFFYTYTGDGFIVNSNDLYGHYMSTSFSPSIKNRINELVNELKQICETYSPILSQGLDLNKIFIPTLRGMRPRTQGEQNEDIDFYKDRFISDYIKKLSLKPDIKKALEKSIFTGLGITKRAREMLLGDLANREAFRQFEKFLSEKYFDSQEIALIPRHDEDVLSIKIGNEKEQPLYELGDGLQSIIIMIFPLFQHLDKKNLVFIEEPENNMHPGFQRKFIESLLDSRFDNNQFLIVTHSNHLLDLTLDINEISVYTTNKILKTEPQEKEALASFVIRNVSHDDMSTLQLLGVQNSSVFLANCTIWVEGITDRLYLRKFLDLYKEHLKDNSSKVKIYDEDLHYSFIEYSGNNITHWSFLDSDDTEEKDKAIKYDRISQNIFLITDKDKGKEERQQKLKTFLGDNFHCLDSVEIENTFKKEKLIEIVLRHFKEEDQKIINDSKELENTEETAFQDNNLGLLLNEKLGPKFGKKFYDGKSKTIRNKLKFCKIAIGLDSEVEVLKTYDDLSEEQKQLTKKIYNFITSNNSCTISPSNSEQK